MGVKGRGGRVAGVAGVGGSRAGECGVSRCGEPCLLLGWFSLLSPVCLPTG